MSKALNTENTVRVILNTEDTETKRGFACNKLSLFMVLLAAPLLLSAQVKLYLQDGVMRNGVISTDKGGVIEDEKIRIQAQTLMYERSSDHETVTASGQLLVIYDKRLLTGKKFTYNFTTREGYIENPMLSSDGWVLTGEKLIFDPDGSLLIEHGDVIPPTNLDFCIGFERIRLQRSSQIQARRLSIRLFKKEILSWSQIRTSLDALTDIPIQFRVSFGGYENIRAGVRYRLIRTEEFKAFLRLDAVLARGLGGGLDTYYKSVDCRRCFDTKSFLIHDRSWDDPDTRLRYRFQGVYREKRGKLNVRACYDWLSDAEMASNYRGKDFELPTAERTELLASYKECNWLADFTTRVRVNDFQTINQELPGFRMSWRPFVLGNSGILCNNRFSAAYLDYVYATGTPGSSDFSSGRVALQSRLYRPFRFRYLLFTPEAGCDLIYYSNSPSGSPQEQAVAIVGATSSVPLFNNNFFCLHTLEPYGSYYLYTHPTAPFGEPFIFTIDDGYGLLSILRAGVRQSFFLKRGPSCFIRKPLFFDLWAIAFFDQHTMEKSVPRIYGAFSWSPFSTLSMKFEGAWNRELNNIDYANSSVLWTVNADLAVKVSFLNRGVRSWRKCDPDNFMLDIIQNELVLQKSIVSDRRNTLLTNVFWRFHPNWTAQFQTHTGWHRITEPAYNEYLVGFTTVILSHWRLGMSFERREIEKRFAFSFKFIR